VDYEKLLNEESTLATSTEISAYHNQLKSIVKETLDIATQAKQVGFDPKKEVEIYIAQDVASRTEGLVGPKGIAIRLKEMEEIEKLSKDKIVVNIAKEIANGTAFDHPNPQVRAEQALRTALSYQTEGITAAPIEGIGKVEIASNQNGSYLSVYYSGPIRSAGGTAQGVSVFIADIIRTELKLKKYQATEQEVERMLEEVRLYNKIMHLQLPTSDEEIRHAWRNIPIMITGDPTEKEEVSGYRNIESMGGNRVRGGACLVLNDGLVGRSKKIMKRINKLEIEGWEWLDEISSGKYSDKRATEKKDGSLPLKVLPDYSFASDALMGRPTFSDATAKGGWRLRYGHARNTGIAGIGVHPGVMAVVNDYLAPGTHVRTERPGKGSIVTPVHTIRPPIVLLNDGTVTEINTYDEGVGIQPEIKEILFLGDMLVGYGEFLQNNYRLCPPGYNEEWWWLELRNKIGTDIGNRKMEYFQEIMENPPEFNEAVVLSKKNGIPLHPRYTLDWKQITSADLRILYDIVWETKDTFLPITVKSILEELLVPHVVNQERIDIGKYMDYIKLQLPIDADLSGEFPTALELVQKICPIKIRDTMGTTVGARMGRPEKAKARRMSPQLHGLFPLGTDKKVKKSLTNAIQEKTITVRLSNRYCDECKKECFDVFCTGCGNETRLIGSCTNKRCRSTMQDDICDNCGSRVGYTRKHEIAMADYIQESYRRIGPIGKTTKLKDVIKNPTGVVELIDKGILRSQYDLHVFRDGTIRYDATDAPLTHFYPFEINTSIEDLLRLGYNKDVYGDPLIHDKQLLEIKPQDIIVHASLQDHLVNVANFVDDELEKVYKLPRYYQIKDKNDIIGHLIIGLAPHTSAGVIGRVIGFTQSSVCWAHPFWHSSKRRNCDGDEDGIILLLDGFLNFSKEYLPTTRGSKMDTPLVLVVTLNPNEVDDESFNLDCVSYYPLELYEAASRLEMPNVVSKLIKRAESRLGKPEQFEGFLFSHSTRNMSEGPLKTRYKDETLNIRDKLSEQLQLAEKIRAVDVKDGALRILEKHVLPDLMGNLRAFASQNVRCITCNTKYRRIPLRGECINENCVRSNLVLTVPPKGVTKYFDICQSLVEDYDLGVYHQDRLDKIKLAINTQFVEKSQPKQYDLSEWI